MNTIARNFTRGLLSSLLITAALLLAGPAAAKKVSGVDLPDTLSVAESTVSLNGAGLRKKLFIKLYVGGLYLADASSDASAIIDADESMAILLHIKSGLLTRKKMLAALKDGFKKSTGGNTAPVQAEIDQMIALMQDDIKPGDVYVMSHEPGVGVHLLRNDAELGLMEGLAFKQALFGIWLSDKPAQASLKKAMLGK